MLKTVQSNFGLRRIEEILFHLFLTIQKILPIKSYSNDSIKTPKTKVLVCKACCFGDAILSLYALREFKSQEKEIEIHVLTSYRAAQVYKALDFIGKVHVFPISGKGIKEFISPLLWFKSLSLLFTLRRQRYSQLIDCELYHLYGPVIKWIAKIPLSRGFRVVGSIEKPHDILMTRDRLEPEWKCYYFLLGLLPPESPLALFEENLQQPRENKIGIVFGSSFNWPQKKWPSQNFIELAKTLSPTWNIVLLGAPSEQQEAERIKREIGKDCEIVVGSSRLEDFIEEIQKCQLILGNDTGAMHMAAACGVKTLSIFGPTEPLKWTPIGGESDFLEALPCRPCYYLSQMPLCEHRSCLRSLTVAMVAEKLNKMLELPLEKAK